MTHFEFDTRPLGRQKERANLYWGTNGLWMIKVVSDHKEQGIAHPVQSHPQQGW